MPPVMPATLAPRTPGGRARDPLRAAVAAAARLRDAMTSADAAGARMREALSAADAGWTRQIRLERQRLRDLRLYQHDLSLFSSKQFNLYRLDGRVVGTWPTPRWEWVPAGRGRPDRLEPLQMLPAFDLPPLYQNVPTPPLHFTHLEINQAYAAGKRAPGGYSPSSGTSGALSAVGLGATVLALSALVLLVWALDRCLEQRLFKQLRRRSDEWFTPNVLATSRHVGEEGSEAGQARPDVPPLPPGDPPPPYSMCLPKSPQAAESAEPPPPYSACYVAFGGPHDVPTVHLNVPTPHLFQDTGQMTGSEVAHNSGVSVTTQAARGPRDGYFNTPAELRTNSEGEALQGAILYPNTLVA